MRIRSNLHWRKRYRLYLELYHGFPVHPVIIKYDEKGFPIKPREYDIERWYKFIAKCDKVIKKRKLTYEEIIENRLVALPRVKYRIRNGAVRHIRRQDIIDAIDKLVSRGHIPFTRSIGDELGMSVWALRELAKKYNLELPHRERWRPQPYNTSKKNEFRAPPSIDSFGKTSI